MQTLSEEPEAFDNRAIIETTQDCFAVIRIENKISSLWSVEFNERPMEEINRQYGLLDDILVKYGLPKCKDEKN